MRYQIGDLVTERTGENFGIVISIKKANSESLILQGRSQQYVNNADNMYYVFFTETRHDGPYFTSELKLKQSTHGITINRW